MTTKLQTLKEHMAAERFPQAVKLAASFPRLGEHKERITRAWAAHSNPDFYRQIGLDPETLFRDGLEAIRERYEL